LATVNAGVVNATSGFKFNGAAPNNHVLVGNGTEYVDSAAIPTSAANYQKAEFNAGPLTGRNIFNVLTPLTAVDDGGNLSTDIGHRTSPVTPSNYLAANITLDQWGHVIAATNGSAVVGTLTDYSSGGRAAGTIYQNTSVGVLYVSGAMRTTGSSVGLVVVKVGPTSSPTINAWQDSSTATVDGGAAGFCAMVPNNYYYEVATSGAVSGTVLSWTETVLS
jgi:hypothetical protein